MINKKQILKLIFIYIIFIGQSCGHYKKDITKAQNLLPKTYSKKSNAPLSNLWWKSLNDIHLTKLILLALEGNFEIKTAWAKLEQIHVIAKQSTSNLLPSINIDLQHTYGKQKDIPLVKGWSSSLSAGYEIDIWGKNINTRKATYLELSANRDYIESLAISISAQVAEIWYSLVSYRNEYHLLNEQKKIFETILKLTQDRVSEGISSIIELYRQQQIFKSIQGEIALNKSKQQVASYQLAILLGKSPNYLIDNTKNILPILPPIPGIGIPAKLLDRRPDIRAALKQIQIADKHINIAIANLLPSLVITTSISSTVISLTKLIDNLVWNAVVSISQPIFNGGKRTLEIQKAKALKKEKIYIYSQNILRAMLEVENALIQEEKQMVFLQRLKEQNLSIQNSFREIQSRYKQGITDYLNVLNQLNNLKENEKRLLYAHRQLLSYRIQLYRALGGDWAQKWADETKHNVNGYKS